MKDSMISMENSDTIADIKKIWHAKAKNSYQEVEFQIYRHPFELGKYLEHEEKTSAMTTSVMTVTKQLRWVGGNPWREIRP